MADPEKPCSVQMNTLQSACRVVKDLVIKQILTLRALRQDFWLNGTATDSSLGALSASRLLYWSTSASPCRMYRQVGLMVLCSSRVRNLGCCGLRVSAKKGLSKSPELPHDPAGCNTKRFKQQCRQGFPANFPSPDANGLVWAT